MGYQEYLFISTNLKAKFDKFISPDEWKRLKDLSYEELEEWLKNSSYSFLLESEDWYKSSWNVLKKDLEEVRRSVRNDEVYNILLWDFYFRNLRIQVHSIKEERVELYPIPLTKDFNKIFKSVYDKAIELWEKTNNIFLVDLFLDLQNIIISQKFFESIANNNIKEFYRFKNNLLLIKVLYRTKRLNIQWDLLKDAGIERVKTTIDLRNIFNSSLNLWNNYFYGIYSRFVGDLIDKNEDIEYLYRSYIFEFIRKFTSIVSGPEVVLFYFYNKYFEMDELITLFKVKRNKISKNIWEKRLLKING